MVHYAIAASTRNSVQAALLGVLEHHPSQQTDGQLPVPTQ